MRTAAHRANARKLAIMALLVVLAAAAYLLLEVNPKYFSYAMSLRIPKLIVMLIAAFSIGGAFFEEKFGKTFAEQIAVVEDYLKK